MAESKIIYTLTDEAPLLATYSFLPIIEAYASTAGVPVETRDISLAGRIFANFPERLRPDQRIGDALAELGALTMDAGSQHHQAAEHQRLRSRSSKKRSRSCSRRATRVPDYPDLPQTDEENAIRATYAKVLGSAVNPVLREGNSDRRAPGLGQAVRARSTRTRWAPGRPNSKTNVAT